MKKSISKQNNDVVEEENNDEDMTCSELNSVADVIEIESKIILTCGGKSISLSRIKSTDYKYNKRIHLL